MSLVELSWADSSGHELGWNDGSPAPSFTVQGVEFRCAFGRWGETAFTICKDRLGIEEYLELIEPFQTDNVVEIGVHWGGSVALTALAAPSQKLVALELNRDRVTALDALIEELGLGDRISVHYGVDQADRERVAAIAQEEFGDEPLGLVIDDASHRLGPTQASFEALFPRLRADGLFVIEDWNHQHLLSGGLAETFADPSPELLAEIERRLEAGALETPISKLVMELVLVAAESDEFVREVRVDGRWARIRRGSGSLDPASFAVRDLISHDFGLFGDQGPRQPSSTA
jgi:cephalosporin hydroxylase